MSIEHAPPSACLSDLALDEWLADEGTASERAAWQAHLGTCTRCERRSAQRSAFNARYLAASQDLELASARAGLGSRSTSSETQPAPPARRLPLRARRAQLLGWLGSGALAAAASVALFSAFSHDIDDGARTKGSSHLDFYVKSGDRVRQGKPGEVVRAGDALRFVVPRAEQRYVVVLGRDSRTVASVYFPLGEVAERAAAGGEVLGSGMALGASVRLDDAPGEERLYGVFCERAVPTQPLREELRTTGRLAAQSGCEVVETSVRKAAP